MYNMNYEHSHWNLAGAIPFMNSKFLISFFFILFLVSCLDVNHAPSITPSAATTQEAEPQSMRTWSRPADGMLMVFIPEGEFMMGSTNGDADEEPVHIVNLEAYWIDRTEITNAMYARCVQDGGCGESNIFPSFKEAYYYNPQYADYPVMYIYWFGARAYCEWAGVRLPSEAEWEKAARGTDGWTYPWGEGTPDCSLANFAGCSSKPSAVGSFPNGQSPYGVLDMAGNVWEWTSSLDWDYPYATGDGREDLSGRKLRILRGGSWNTTAYQLRTTRRYGEDPNYAGFSASGFGFRCARSVFEGE